MTDEFWLAHTQLGLSWDELCDITLMGFDAAFLPYSEKTALLDQISSEILALSPSD